MSILHLWKQICVYALSIVLYLFTPADSAEIEQLTFCGSSSENSLSNLVLVSTLDGQLSALGGKNGEKQWTLDFEDGPMLSSSIHRRELNDNGQWVRLIPSLKGGLYKFDGDNLEAVPVSTDQLLHSSFRYSDDLVFSGGKETKSYGVSSKTGKILYECGIGGCTNHTTDKVYIEQEVLIVQRFQQTVRAIEPQTGIERWNFSVGQHDLALLPQADAGCYDNTTNHLQDVEFKVIVPEGLIWAVNKSNPAVKLWQYKFDSPIVSIWQMDRTKGNDNGSGLKEINLFDSSQWSWGSEFSASSGIYLGMHNKQLYVQENTELRRITKSSSTKLQPLKFPWQPYRAVGSAISNSLSDSIENNNVDVLALEEPEAQSTTALSVLYNSEFINGYGFYLYSKKQMQLEGNSQYNTSSPDLIIMHDKESATINDTNEEDTPVQVIIVSLWYWWKEVLIISFTTAIVLNFMLTQRLLNFTSGTKDAILPPLIIERHIETKKSDESVANGGQNTEIFKSRYLTDFEPVDCLGKGGYGVVFEAKNNIDDCNYAIKRIALPNSQDSRDRVMREVKALAKLDHHNIVRYFNAWLECPPAGWLEQHDLQWINKQNFSSEFPSEMLQNDTKLNTSICIEVSHTDHSSVDSACEAYDLNNYDRETGEDSFIIFGRSDKSDSNKEAINISDGSTQSSDLSSEQNELEEISNHSYVSHSDNIVFQPSTEVVIDTKSKNTGSQSAFELNLNNGTTNRKSAKMFLYIQMQLCQRLSLREWLKKQSTSRDYRKVLSIFYQIVDAVEYVHLQGLIHRDLKPSNIFFAYDETIKIGDFGLVTAMIEGYDEVHTPSEQNENVTLKSCLHTAHVGTHLYMSPEQMSGQVYNYKVDIYSLGIILFELLIPFSTEMERIISLTNLRKSMFPKDFCNNYPAEYELLKIMLDDSPEKRPTTLGIKAKPPLLTYEIENGFSIDKSSKWYFELPQLSRHSSVTNSSNSDSWENVI